ncbi:MAG: hypothetical protein FJW30_15245 [Acidobacteria bacterium]|nr:hypothetical protein [Acidobacteriota bacterium]
MTALLVLAQFLIPTGERVGKLVEEVFTSKSYSELRCTITPSPPRLGFSFVHWAGFSAAIPIRQFEGRPVTLAVAIEIAAKGAPPVYLGERFGVDGAPEGKQYPKDAQLFYGGGYNLGPGEYRVRAYVASDGARTCKKTWSIRVRDAGPVKSRLEANQITSVGGERWRGLDSSQPPRRVFVVLDAAPLLPRRNMVRLSSYDRSLLLTSLTTIFDKGAFTHATVIAADSRNRKIIFKEPEFGSRALGRLGRALGEVNLGSVSVETLKGPGPSAFLEAVLKENREAFQAADTVIFLGPAWGWNGSLTPLLRELAGSAPPMHHIGLTRYPGLPDNLLAGFVKAGSGSARQVFTPSDLAKAIERMRAK